MILVALLFLVPFLWSLATSFMPLPETAQGFHLIPNNPTIHVSQRPASRIRILDFVRVYGVTAGCLAVSVIAHEPGPGLARRIRVRAAPLSGPEPLFGAVLATPMIPDQLRLVPVFQMLSNFPLFPLEPDQ